MDDILIPLCFFPTTTIFVDDNLSFLESVGDILATLGPLQCFSSPLEAEKFFHGRVAKNFTQQLRLPVRERENWQLPTLFDFRLLRNLAGDPARNEEIAVLVSDYSMPDRTGLELCQRIGIPAFDVFF